MLSYRRDAQVIRKVTLTAPRYISTYSRWCKQEHDALMKVLMRTASRDNGLAEHGNARDFEETKTLAEFVMGPRTSITSLQCCACRMLFVTERW